MDSQELRDKLGCTENHRVVWISVYGGGKELQHMELAAVRLVTPFVTGVSPYLEIVAVANDEK